MDAGAGNWRSGFQLIEESVRVSANDLVPGDSEAVSCGCKSSGHRQFTCYDDRCINFATQTECVRCSTYCSNNKFQKRKWMEVEVRKCAHKGHGLFAKERIREREFVAEFAGEIISATDLQARMKKSAKEDVHTYMIELKRKTYIDCTRKGSIARFINHSCEPNCRLEVWTVRDRLRVGVFAIADVEEGGELSFDYQWEPSDRPPTKCFCGAPTCRGYLEIFKSDRDRLSRLGCGVWVSCKDKGNDSANAILDAAGDLVPEHLVGKRVKFWDEELQRYVEAKVLDHEQGYAFSAFHFWSKEQATIDLASSANWYWFDETRAVVTIRKKEEGAQEDPDGPDDAALSAQASAATDDSTAPADPASPRVPQRVVERNCFRVKSSVARLMAYPAAVRHADELSALDFQRLQIDFTQHLRAFYDVQAKALALAAGSVHEIELEVFGETAQLQHLRRAIRGAHEACKETELALQRLKDDALRRRQAAVLTVDWRLLPIAGEQWDDSLCRAAVGVSAQLLRALRDMPVGAQSRLLGPKELLTISVDKASAGLSAGSRAVETQLAGSLREIVRKLKLPRAVSVHAIALLLRYLGLAGDAAQKDSFVTLAAAVLLAVKAQALFKYRLVARTVCVAYCEVFARDERDVGDSTDTYLARVCDKEGDIYRALRHDVFAPNMHPLLAHEAQAQPSKDRERVVHAVGHLLELTSVAVEALVVQFPKVVCAFPPDLLQFGALLVLFALEVLGLGVQGIPQVTQLLERCAKKCEFSHVVLRWAAGFVWSLMKEGAEGLRELPRLHAALVSAVDVSTNVLTVLESTVLQQLAATHRPPLPPCACGSGAEAHALKTKVHPCMLPVSRSALELPIQSAALLQTDTVLAVISAEDVAAHSLPEEGWEDRSQPSEVQPTAAQPITARAIPPWKVAAKEAKKFNALQLGAAVLLPQEVGELTLLQHLHYYSKDSSESSSPHVGTRHIARPFAVATLAEASLMDAGRPATRPAQRDESDTEFDPSDARGLARLGAQRLLAFAPVRFALSAVLDAGTVIPADLAALWTAQLFCALDFMISRGVYARWLDPQHLYVTRGGDLLLGSVLGCEIVGRPAKDPATVGAATAGGSDADLPKAAPAGLLHLTAPEVLLGAAPSPQSTAFCAGALACVLLTGKPFVKSAKDERKQIDYFFRVLGTPKAMDYHGFGLLPHSSRCKAQLQKEDGSWTESRSRLVKVVAALAKERPGSEHVAQLVQACCGLVPEARSLPTKAAVAPILRPHRWAAACVGAGPGQVQVQDEEDKKATVYKFTQDLRASKHGPRNWTQIDALLQRNCAIEDDAAGEVGRLRVRSQSPQRLEGGSKRRKSLE